MSGKTHHYAVRTVWTGNRGSGTSGYGAYGRDHELFAGDKPVIPGSADRAFRGDPKRWNPEDLLVASVSACHQLWYLHLCASAGIVVMAYEDEAEGVMEETPGAGGRFTGVVLKPRVTIAAGSDADRAARLHAEANALCFIANSLNFRVAHEAEIVVSGRGAV